MAEITLFDPVEGSEDQQTGYSEASVLDQILSVADEDHEVSGTPEASRTEWQSSSPHSSVWPHKAATKQDKTKLSFFDLPPEIRVTIYETYCETALNHLDRTGLPVTPTAIRDGIPILSLKPGLICHQMRKEFVPTWAQYHTFLLSKPHKLSGPKGLRAQLDELSDIWIQVRDLLQWLGPIARSHVRTIRICHIWETQRAMLNARDPKWRSPEPVLQAETADYLMSIMERLSDVHSGLKIEVELRGISNDQFLGSSDGICRSMRRIFTLRQRQYGRQAKLDWIVVAGEVQILEFDFTGYVNPFRREEPLSQRYGDAAWQTVEEGIEWINQSLTQFS